MPGLIGSLYIGQGGLNASGVGVSVVSDNIANSNTTGYKSSRAHFEDLLSELVVGTTGANQLGRGVTTTRIEKLFTQGSFQSTGVATDMAISGDGFFVVSGASSGQSQNLYTRNGAFRFDDEGFLITQNGSRVQGYNGDNAGGLSSFLEDLRITQRYLQPLPTSEVECFANLRPDDPVSGPFDPQFPEDTSTFRTATIVFDSLGNAHEVTIFGTRNGQNTWEVNAIVDGSEIDGADPALPFQIPLGQLNFDNSGRLVEEVVPDPIQIDWLGADPGQISFNFGDAIADGGTGTSGSSQWNRVTESVANFVGQDGYGTGELDGISIDDTGLITGGFTNGQTLIMGRVALARFEDPTGLDSVGGSSFVETNVSGGASIGDARSGGRGAIISSALELANVELSSQFIDLISYQRAFQANSRTIQTADGLLQEVFQILR